MQVLELLQAAGITQNFEFISQEKIPGDILIELDDDVIKNELGITSVVQRLKLRRIIDGRRSITQYITVGESSLMDTFC